MCLIPKIIHYCWFGRGPMPDLERKCLESWANFLPDYKIMLWNEDNFDINSNIYVKQAYEVKKYAFVSDYARLYALYNYGGLYLDTDVEVIKNLDQFLIYPAFAGLEQPDWISTCLIGAVKEHPWLSRWLAYYSAKSFYLDNGNMDLTTNVATITEISEMEFYMKRVNKFQILKNDIYLYPAEYFCPKDWSSKKMIITENTHAIHHFAGSWLK